jgi:hypothetical protein
MFDSFYFDLGVTTIALCFQALGGKEEKMVDDTPVGCPEVVVDLEVAKIASQNLSSSDV